MAGKKLCPLRQEHPSYLTPSPPASSPKHRKLKNTPSPRCSSCSGHSSPAICSRAVHGHSTTWTKLQFQQACDRDHLGHLHDPHPRSRKSHLALRDGPPGPGRTRGGPRPQRERRARGRRRAEVGPAPAVLPCLQTVPGCRGSSQPLGSQGSPPAVGSQTPSQCMNSPDHSGQ